MKVFRKYISLALAVVMLVMSVGITAHKMVCLMSGAVTLSFLSSDDCCPVETKDSNSIEANCCDYSTDYFKLDIQTLVSSFNFKFDFVADFFTLPSFSFSEVITGIITNECHSPPLLSGQDILILVSVFRI